MDFKKAIIKIIMKCKKEERLETIHRIMKRYLTD